MNNSQNTPDDTATPDAELSQTQLDARAAATTVFSDGSTFDYENGYQNNGAPVATRDREEKPTITKSHKILTFDRFVVAILWLFTTCLVLGMAVAGVFYFQRMDNIKAFKDGVDGSGQVKILQITDGDAVVKRPDGSLFKCSVSYVSNSGTPAALVFCSPGAPATFTIPLPHDPTNLFYVGPTDN